MQLNEYMERIMEERLADLHTVALAKIISFNNGTMTGSVKPLFAKVLQDGTQLSPPVISGVPVAGVRSGEWTARIPYKSGDVVLIAYAERAIDSAKSGEEGDPGYNRKHSIDDAVIIGGILTSGVVSGDGIIIENDKTRVQLDDNGDVNINSENVNINTNGNTTVTTTGNTAVTTTGNISLTANPGSISISAPVGGVTIDGPESSGSW